jgi:hypothetical protein
MKTKYILLISVVIGLALYSCVQDEIFQGPPIISEVTINPQAPGTGESVTVTAKVRDLNGVEEVKLYYKVGSGSFTSGVMTGSGDLFSATIPAQEAGSTVQYYIEASNVIGKSVTSPGAAPATTAAYTVGAALIVMNEIQPRGGTGADADWSEI